MIHRIAPVFAFLLLFIITSAAAKSETTNITARVYKGHLGEYDIEMLLYFKQGKSVSGSYVYLKAGNSFELDLIKLTKDSLILKESHQKPLRANGELTRHNIVSGRFHINIKNIDTVKGFWAKIKPGSSHLDISLVKVFEASYQINDKDIVYKSRLREHLKDTLLIMNLSELKFNILPFEKARTLLDVEYKNPVLTYMEENNLQSFDQFDQVTLKKLKIMNVDSILSSMDEINETMPYEDNEYYDVAYIDGILLSMANYRNGFSGGAHGYESADFTSYELKKGSKISLPELFLSGYERYLDSTCNVYFRKARVLKPGQPLTESECYDDTFRMAKNFYFGLGGIYFVYNEYEIMPYVEGLFDYMVPYKALRKIINPSGPLGYILKRD